MSNTLSLHDALPIYLNMLQNIVKSIQDDNLMQTIRNATKPEEVVSIVRPMIPADTEDS